MNWNYRICRAGLYKQLGIIGDKIPPDLEWSGVIEAPIDRSGDRTIRLEIGIVKAVKVPGRKSSQHRIFCKCPKCGTSVPTGRLHQHVGTGTCRS